MKHVFTKVLLIDDDPICQLISQKLLEKMHLAAEILRFDHGQQALTYFQSQCHSGESLPDLILLDVNMPVMNGIELLERLKASNRWELIASVVLLTSSTHPKDYERAKGFPIRSWIQKPLSPEKISTLLTTCFEEKACLGGQAG